MIIGSSRKGLIFNSDFLDIDLVSDFKLLGVCVDENLTFTNHVCNILSQCNSRLYLLKLLRDRGLHIKSLHSIYVSLIVNRITYAVSAWGGLISQRHIDKINAMFKRARKYGFTDTVYDYRGLLYHCDATLFNKARSDLHCLNRFLPTRQLDYGQRDRDHNYALPICKSSLYRNSFIPRFLFS